MALISLLLMLASAVGSANECPSTTPMEAVAALRMSHPDFYLHPEQSRQHISATLYELLLRESRCPAGELCAIEADPWTGTQDGDMVEPVMLTQESESNANAKISMCYQISLGGTYVRNQCTTVLLVRGPNECWVLDDLIPATGSSLKSVLQSEHGL